MSQVYKGANELVEAHMMGCLAEIERFYEADCVAYSGPIAFGADDDFREAIEAIDNKKKKLLVILETQGGFAETCRRIADTFRHHYQTVDFLVPSYAMSAGTILVMSGDAIHMDYYSVLGPIDPQVEGKDGGLIPALGYLVKYEQMLERAKAGKISQAEMEILLSFDQGQLYAYEQARDLSLSLLQEWLCKHKWKNWTVTRTRQVPVTAQMKQDKATEIAKKLNDTTLWNSHGIGIGIEQLTKVLGLEIDDFGQSPEKNNAIRQYHKLWTNYMMRMGHISSIHTRVAYRPIHQMNSN
jgi:hypothetical protein